MKVRRVRVDQFPLGTGAWSFITVETDSGTTGVGEATVLGYEAVIQAEVARISRLVTGLDPLNRTALGQIVQPRIAGRLQAAVFSAVEQAFWDISAKHLGLPLYRLLGGPARPQVAAYANVNRGLVDRTPEGFSKAALKAEKDGFRAIKIAPFDDVDWLYDWRVNLSKPLDAALERISAVRSAIGPGPELMVDCHWRLNETIAAEIMPRLSEMGVSWLETPVRELRHDPGPARRLRSLAHSHGLRLAGAEMEFGLGEFIAVLNQEVYDVLMPDVRYCGGIEALKQVSDAAASLGIIVAPHNADGPVGHAASVHLCMAAHNAGFLETQYGHLERYRDAVSGELPSIRNGYVRAPELPGLGLEVAVSEERGIKGLPSAGHAQ